MFLLEEAPRLYVERVAKVQYARITEAAAVLFPTTVAHNGNLLQIITTQIRPHAPRGPQDGLSAAKNWGKHIYLRRGNFGQNKRHPLALPEAFHKLYKRPDGILHQ